MIDDKINQANGRLRNANVRVKIQRFGDRLYLRATLPPKPGSRATQHTQQRIALGVSASPSGVSLAEKEARKISALLDCKEFNWYPYLSAQQKPPETVGEWVARFEAEFRDAVSEITWQTDYREVFIKLDGDRCRSGSKGDRTAKLHNDITQSELGEPNHPISAQTDNSLITVQRL